VYAHDFYHYKMFNLMQNGTNASMCSGLRRTI